MSENKTYDEIAIGDRAILKRVCTENDLIVFAHASGNLNPLHLPRAHGMPTEGSETVAPSMWGGSLFSAVLGNVLPGMGTLYRSQHLDFQGRAHVGDELTIEVVATQKRPDRLVVFDCALTNQRGELIASGEARVIAPAEKLRADVELPDLFVRPHQHFKRVIESLADVEPMRTAVVCPTDANSLGGALRSLGSE